MRFCSHPMACEESPVLENHVECDRRLLFPLVAMGLDGDRL
ncbi:MAG: hypothetical protein AAFW84_31350 [Cyanobacteria bacterium J06635_15]